MRWVSNSNSKALTKTRDKIKTFYLKNLQRRIKMNSNLISEFFPSLWSKTYLQVGKEKA